MASSGVCTRSPRLKNECKKILVETAAASHSTHSRTTSRFQIYEISREEQQRERVESQFWGIQCVSEATSLHYYNALQCSLFTKNHYCHSMRAHTTFSGGRIMMMMIKNKERRFQYERNPFAHLSRRFLDGLKLHVRAFHRLSLALLCCSMSVVGKYQVKCIWYAICYTYTHCRLRHKNHASSPLSSHEPAQEDENLTLNRFQFYFVHFLPSSSLNCRACTHIGCGVSARILKTMEQNGWKRKREKRGEHLGSAENEDEWLKTENVSTLLA